MGSGHSQSDKHAPDVTYGDTVGIPPNSSVVKAQLSGVVISGQFSYNVHISGRNVVSQGGIIASGIVVTEQFGAFSGIHTALVPQSESSWNV